MAALSFVNPDELAESVGPLARGTIVSQVIPSPRLANQVSAPLAKECADALHAFNGAKLNYTSFESCIAAQVLAAALKKAGPKPTRESILAAMGSIGRLDLGGFSMQFSPTRRHGSSWVELTVLSRGNRFQSAAPMAQAGAVMLRHDIDPMPDRQPSRVTALRRHGDA